MKPIHLLNLLFALFISNISKAQNTFDVIFPITDRAEVCADCFEFFKQKPKEIYFSIQREGNNLYFQVNDKDWFKGFIKNENDGIAVDIVNKERYDCDLYTIVQKQIKGELLKPIYGQKLLSGLKPFGTNLFRVHVGKIPEELMGNELEYNILFLKNKNLCRYRSTYNLESYPWDLLDMGLYLDSLTYISKKIKSNEKDAFIISNKTIVFKIPFKKNKATYSQADIKPIYDSLRLTDFNIKSINIKAYSSVEGSLENNKALQEKRAKSIVEALQAFQKATIKTQVSSSENWVEFLNDIQTTQYANLGSLSKEEIKDQLVGALSKELEPFLQQHRKAILKLELEKKDAYVKMSADELVSKFNAAISAEKLDEAKAIRNSIYNKMFYREISPEYLEKMQIPKQALFADFQKSNASLEAMFDESKSFVVYNELLALEQLVPKDGTVKYNITALKIKLWRYGTIEIKELELKNQINDLKKYGISSPLIDRMLVNFHIIKAENQLRERDYKNKDISVDFIKNNYKNFKLSDYDYLSLAQFFTYYSNIETAAELLENKVRTIEIDEDLLFYYINLTIIDDDLTQNPEYRTMLLNAINLNKVRFCKLFDPVEKDGLTFQLMENAFLRDTYCESCKAEE